MGSQTRSTPDRRSLLTRAGGGALALGALPGLLGPAPARARGRGSGFSFTAISQAGTIGPVAHAVNMAGAGTIEQLALRHAGRCASAADR